jgi:hypothetical protein
MESNSSIFRTPEPGIFGQLWYMRDQPTISLSGKTGGHEMVSVQAEQPHVSLRMPTKFRQWRELLRVLYMPGQWLDVDDAADLTAAGRFL